MRKLSVFVVLAFMAAPAFAQDGNVSQDALASLGLGGMELISDAQGMEIRGMSANAQSTGLSLFGMFLYDPNTGSAIQLNGSNFARGTAENAGLQAATTAGSTTAVATVPIVAKISGTNGVWEVEISAIQVGGIGAASGQ